MNVGTENHQRRTANEKLIAARWSVVDSPWTVNPSTNISPLSSRTSPVPLKVGGSIGTGMAADFGMPLTLLDQRDPPFCRVNSAGKQILFSGYHMNDTSLDAYVGELRRRKPPWLHGYPSLLALLASHSLDRGLELGYPVRWVTIGAENLLPQQAELIHRAFGVYPLQHYGMAEAVANFSECERGRLHVDEDFATVEFLPNFDGPGYPLYGPTATFRNWQTAVGRIGHCGG